MAKGFGRKNQKNGNNKRQKAHLAKAYWARIQGEKAENLELAINCLQAALQVATFE